MSEFIFSDAAYYKLDDMMELAANLSYRPPLRTVMANRL